jgi:hypothetical protein
MKKMLVLGGVGIALLVACDRSIESRLQQNTSDNTKQSATTNAEEKTVQAVEKNEGIAKPQKDLLPEEIKGIKEIEPPKEVIHKEIVNESSSVNQPVSEKAPQITSETNIAPVKKASEIKKENSKKAAQPETKLSTKSEIKSNTRVSVLEKNVSKPTKLSQKNTVVKKRTAKNIKSKDEHNLASVIENKKVSLVDNKFNNDGTYDNDHLVSNFTEEELRLGAQRPLTKDEIQYYKSLCRYAYMSEQDVIDNRCEYKQANR